LLTRDTEHNVLYQVNINKAENVFIGLQEGEAAYWQGKENTRLAPAPWTQSLWDTDPDFAWCQANEAMVCSVPGTYLFPCLPA
jgi:glucan 1,3-beta-glucosidase